MEKLPNRIHDERPWGSFEQFTLNEQTTVKTLTIAPGEAFSLQTHDHREEYWYVLSGTGTIEIGEQTFESKAGDEFYVPHEVTHRITGGPDGIHILEIAFGAFDEEDITRIEDKYGRT